MDTSTIILALASVGTLAGGLTTLITTLRGLRAAVAPARRRGTIRWALLAGSAASGADRFAASAGRAAFGSPVQIKIGAHTAAAAPGLVGCGAVVIYGPSQEELDQLLPLIMEVAPAAAILIYTERRLERCPMGQVLLSQSAVRLLGDLIAVAEGGA